MSDKLNEQKKSASQDEQKIVVFDAKTKTLALNNPQNSDSFNMSISQLLDVLLWVHTLQ